MPNLCTTCLNPEPIVLHYALTPSAITNTLPKPVRMMVYVGLLYQDLIRRGDVLPGNRLPPVLPIVLYNGAAPWKVAADIADLIPRAPGSVAHYLPHLKYLLIEQNQYTDETLTAMHNLVAAIIRVEHPASSQTL